MEFKNDNDLLEKHFVYIERKFSYLTSETLL